MSTDARPSILVVDDDELVRESLGSSLRGHGFAVHLAAAGEEAVAVYRQHGHDIGVVLLDVRMPGMDGPQTLLVLRQLNPSVRCCFMTGYIEGYSRQELLAFGAHDVFLKPFNIAEVTQVVRHLLSDKKPVVGTGDEGPN